MERDQKILLPIQVHLFSGGERQLVNYEDKLKKMKESIPLTNEIECPKCKEKFYDEYNCICLGALNMCLLCANRNLDKETIKEKYNE